MGLFSTSGEVRVAVEIICPLSLVKQVWLGLGQTGVAWPWSNRCGLALSLVKQVWLGTLRIKRSVWTIFLQIKYLQFRIFYR